MWSCGLRHNWPFWDEGSMDAASQGSLHAQGAAAFFRTVCVQGQGERSFLKLLVQGQWLLCTYLSFIYFVG